MTEYHPNPESFRCPHPRSESASGGPDRGGPSGTPPLYQRCQNDKDPSDGVENADAFGVDWVTMTGPGEGLKEVADEVDALLPDESPKPVRNKRYAGGRQWPCGLSLTTEYLQSDRWRLDIPGNACRVLGLLKVHSLARKAMFAGAHCTRLDLMRDQFGDCLTLVDDVVTACRLGYLRLARRFKVFDECDADGVTKQGHGVYLGSSGSDRFVRCYDKGIEQGASRRGLWIRTELQQRGAFAKQAAEHVFGAADPYVGTIAGLVCGAVDFRIGPRGDGVPWRRFQRCPFWSAFVAGFDCARVRLEGVPPDLDRWLGWVNTVAGGPLVEAARQAGVPLGTALELVFAGVQVNEGTRRNPILGYLADFFRQHLRP
jgi:hypothetical protein